MAGRIRSIKPEILDDERSAGLSDAAWRLWVSMWLLADDHGRSRGSPIWLESQVFWASRHPRETVARLLEELATARLIVQYGVDGQRYIEIRNWVKHQKVDHPGKPRVPAPLDVSALFIQQVAENPRESLEKLSDGIASIGETLAPDLRSPTADLDHRSPIGTAASPPPSRNGNGRNKATATHPDAIGLLEELNQARKEAIPGSRNLKPTMDNLQFIAERLNAGNTPDDIRNVIAVCAAEARQSPEAAKWFDAVTPFISKNFGRKVGRDPGKAAVSQRELPGYARLPKAPRDAVPEGQGGTLDPEASDKAGKEICR